MTDEESAKIDRLALIRAKLGGPKVVRPYKPPGMNVAVNPDEATVRKKPWRDNLATRKDRNMRGLGNYDSLQLYNTRWLRSWKPGKPKVLGERRGKKVSALTKIAHAKPEKLGRVPPWQKRK